MARNNIVLYQPEIPQNVGNIMRTAFAGGAVLHMIEPLGFSLASRYLRRSGVNYIDQVEYRLYCDLMNFPRKSGREYFFLTRYGERMFYEGNLRTRERIIISFSAGNRPGFRRRS